MAHDQDPRRSSVAIGGEQKKRSPLWLLLGLLALLIVIAIIVGLVSCGDDGDDKAATPATPTAPAESTPTTGASTPAPAPEAGAEATLAAGSASLLAADAPAISDHVGETARGEELEVLSVTESGFFVGTDESDRQYVESGGKVGGDEGLGEKPEVGDKVGLAGEIRPAPKSPAETLKLEADAAQTVTERKAYVNATSVVPAG